VIELCADVVFVGYKRNKMWNLVLSDVLRYSESTRGIKWHVFFSK